uniref:Putative secreted protein n=1 Tax=Ixodes ricinus TaxID=34613 RepID=A0A6B0U262_IXORI
MFVCCVLILCIATLFPTVIGNNMCFLLYYCCETASIPIERSVCSLFHVFKYSECKCCTFAHLFIYCYTTFL